MRYISTKEVSEKWGIHQSRVLKLAREGRIEGARLFGNNWMFPENAKKPADGRTKSARSIKEKATFFRFPLYVNFSEESYTPPLSPEELILRKAQKDFQAGRFDSVKEPLIALCSADTDRYLRLSALCLRCYLAIYTPVEEDYNAISFEVNALLSEDFPYKQEVRLLRDGLLLDYGDYKPIFETFSVEPSYTYHPSARYMLALIALIPIEGGRLSLLSELRYDTQELLCQMMESDGYFLEAQQLHFLLLIVYQLKGDRERMMFHIRQGLQLAIERELYFYPAYYCPFYHEAIMEVLREFPDEFGAKITSLGAIISESYRSFTLERGDLSFLGMLSDKEFEYAFLASQGLTNREVAQKLGVSEKTVSKRYADIYDKLKVKDKTSLIELINRTHGGREA